MTLLLQTVLSTTPLPQPLIVNQAHGQNVQLLLIQGQGNAQHIIPVQSSAQNEVHRSTAAQEEGTLTYTQVKVIFL